jgi:hypothetical protein
VVSVWQCISSFHRVHLTQPPTVSHRSKIERNSGY